jgi:hypothetical protein
MLFTYYKNKKNTTIRYFTAYSFIYFFAFFLFSLRNQIPDFLSIVVANSLLAASSITLYIITKKILNKLSHFSWRYYIPVFIILFGHAIFTYIGPNTQIKMVVFALFCIVYSSLQAYYFMAYGLKNHRTYNILSSLLFSSFALAFVLVIFYALSIQIHTFYFSNAHFILILPNILLFFLVFWVIYSVKNHAKN